MKDDTLNIITTSTEKLFTLLYSIFNILFYDLQQPLEIKPVVSRKKMENVFFMYLESEQDSAFFYLDL